MQCVLIAMSFRSVLVSQSWRALGGLVEVVRTK
jgi:hypothetical protein